MPTTPILPLAAPCSASSAADAGAEVVVLGEDVALARHPDVVDAGASACVPGVGARGDDGDGVAPRQQHDVRGAHDGRVAAGVGEVAVAADHPVAEDHDRIEPLVLQALPDPVAAAANERRGGHAAILCGADM